MTATPDGQKRRGRPPKARPEASESTVNGAQVAQDFAVVSADSSRLAEIDAYYSDGLPYNRDRIEGEIRALAMQTAAGMLEMGRRLIVLKEHEPHGEFMGSIERLGMNYRTAARMMQASAKYMTPALQDKLPKLLALPQTKLFELMVEDDDELAALGEGGTVAGMTLDDIDRMSVRELRAALREKDADLAAQEELLNEKNRKLDSLTKKKRGGELADWQLRLTEIQGDITAGVAHAKEMIGALRGLAQQITDVDDDLPADKAGADAMNRVARAYSDAVGRLVEEVAALRRECREWTEPYLNLATDVLPEDEELGS